MAANTRQERTVTTSMRQVTNFNWKVRGEVVVLAHLREDMALWNRVREVASLSCKLRVLVMTKVFSA